MSPSEIYTLSLHDALPISAPPTSAPPAPAWGEPSGAPAWEAPRTEEPAAPPAPSWGAPGGAPAAAPAPARSEEHTSELQSRRDLVCRLLLENKKNYNRIFY